MSYRLVELGWNKEVSEALKRDADELRVVCPFIKMGALERLICRHPKSLKVVTRFNLNDFAAGVSDIAALRRILGAGGHVRGIRHLHSKLYIFGSKRAVLTSANLTAAGLDRNHEFGAVIDDKSGITTCRTYFERLWNGARTDLTLKKVEEWAGLLGQYQRTNPKPPAGLQDFGQDIGLPDPSTQPPTVPIISQAFVKFFGTAKNRAPLSVPIFDQIQRLGCNWALTYPAAKRPKSVRDGAHIFIARLTDGPKDIRIFGRAIGMQHVPGLDDATPAEIKHRPWKKDWPLYIRIHDPEFVEGTMANGVSLNELMRELGVNAFASTKRNALAGKGNTDPHQSYRQQAAVELSPEGRNWLDEKLGVALSLHGRISDKKLSTIN